ncbi:TonB-dependent receptor [Parasphingopyxis marina]|uniref:TonB-dependent receptor n=1 Tax=Parasphingopyxis marina TaxID=2761622 RepID=A0A842I1F7_9SPHN|nr:TonB-dependent receptor [Parasphingopyxis marina]MBC2778985.1 TonB-dependent receptor [Parasphingopyxis marina]
MGYQGNCAIGRKSVRRGSCSSKAFILALGLGFGLAPQSALANDEAQAGNQGQNAGAGPPVAADAGQDIGLGAIVVTARRVSELLQESPVAVTAMSGEELESRSLRNITDIGGTVPNLTLTGGAPNGGGSNSSVIFIRGVGQTDFLPTTDSGVAIYVDGVNFSRSVGSVVDLLDLERLEVLRGPQGTLFGRNTIGGVINLVSSRPRSELGGYVEATIGNYDRTDFRTVLDIPMASNLNSRFAVSYNRRDGYADVRAWDFATSTPGRVVDDRGDQNRLSVRAIFDWQASDNFNATLAMDYAHSRENPAPVNLLEYTGGPKPVPALGDLWNGLVGIPNGTPMSTAFISDDVDTTFGIQNAVNDLDQGGVALTLELDVGAATLKSISSYRVVDALFGRDGDGSPIDWQSTLNDQHNEQLSQEFSIAGTGFDDRLTWTAGLFYLNEDNTDRNHIIVTPGLYSALEALPGQLPNPVNTSCAPPWIAPGCPGNPINVSLDIDLAAYNRVQSESYGIFGQASFSLTDALRLTVGMRYSYDKKDYTLEHRRQVSNTFVVPLTNLNDSWDAFTPMVSLDYQVTDDLLLYGSFASGYKSGGFNGRPLSAAEAQSFDPEYVDSFEVGFKSQWFDNRLRLNVAAFLSRYKDMQFSANVFNPDTGNLELIIDNVGRADITGVEVELEARPVPALSIRGSLGYTHFNITDLTADVPGVTADSQQPFTPRWTGSLGVAYDWAIGDGNLNTRIDWTYQSDSFADIQNTPSLVHQASNLFNARMTYTPPDENWDFSVWVTNLTNERFVATGVQTLDSFGHVEGTYNPPRMWGLTVRRQIY